MPDNPYRHHLDITPEVLSLMSSADRTHLDERGLLGDYFIQTDGEHEDPRTRQVLERQLAGEGWEVRRWLRERVVLPRLKRYVKDLLGMIEGGVDSDVRRVIEEEVEGLRRWLERDDRLFGSQGG